MVGKGDMLALNMFPVGNHVSSFHKVGKMVKYYFIFIGACGKYGAYFSRGPSKTVSNVGNIELCYKLCKSTSSCKAWTYDLNKFSCTLNENSNALKSYMVHKAYHSAYNARISGPKECRLWR